MATQPLEDRFWSKVDRRGPNECWPWVGWRSRGYGRIYDNGRGLRAHRLAWQIAHRSEVPSGMFICHSCDNPWCVNPAHLWAGSPADNHNDMVAKGRRATIRGEAHSSAKLTDAAVRVIRRDLRGYRRLAQVFGVSPSAIRLARKGKTWASV